MLKPFSMDAFSKCCALFIQVFNSPPWNDNWTDDTAQAHLRELTEHKRFAGFTLWDKEALLGAVFFHSSSHYKGDEIFIDELFIDPACQRKGYGTILMDAVETFAQENGLVNITLLTGRNLPPFAFYEKRGYRTLDWLAFMCKHIVKEERR